MIRQQGERTSFDEEMEMADSKMGGQKFTVKGGIVGFSGRGGGDCCGRKRPESLLEALRVLLHDSTYMGGGSISG